VKWYIVEIKSTDEDIAEFNRRLVNYYKNPSQAIAIKESHAGVEIWIWTIVLSL
jgi:hypothetical protein